MSCAGEGRAEECVRARAFLHACRQAYLEMSPRAACRKKDLRGELCGVELLVAARAGHQLADGVFGTLVLVEDGVHLFGDGHLDAVAGGQSERGCGAANPFGDLAAEACDALRKLAAATQFNANSAVARERPRARKHQVSEARESGQGLAATSTRDGEAGDLGDAAGDQRGGGVVPQIQSRGK